MASANVHGHGVCPGCGRCRICGQPAPAPYYPPYRPYPWTWPYWVNTGTANPNVTTYTQTNPPQGASSA